MVVEGTRVSAHSSVAAHVLLLSLMLLMQVVVVGVKSAVEHGRWSWDTLVGHCQLCSSGDMP
jgi:hypothetical protein